MLDGFVVGCCPNPKCADVIDGYAPVHRDPKAAYARIDRQARASRRRQELDLCVEGPPTKTAAGATMDGDIGATLRQDRSESVSDECQSTTECIEARDPWPAFSPRMRRKNDRPPTLQGETPHSIVRLQTKAR
jgi:hypothetical protein